jgi:enoyl-CoA hydratase/carnithine racemase
MSNFRPGSLAVKLGKQIAPKAPLAVRLATASITRGFEGRLDDGIELERDLFSCTAQLHARSLRGRSG